MLAVFHQGHASLICDDSDAQMVHFQLFSRQKPNGNGKTSQGRELKTSDGSDAFPLSGKPMMAKSIRRGGRKCVILSRASASG